MRPTRIVPAVLVSAALVAAGVLGFPTSASAATVTTTTANGLEFQADDSNVAAGATVTGYTGIGTSLVVPATVVISGTTYTVTSIADGDPFNVTISGAFTSLVLPDSLTSVGDFAFDNDTALTSVTFGTGLVSIGNYAFAFDPLVTISLPHVVEVFAYAFIGATETELTLPDSAQSIHGFAFAQENSLASLTLPASTNLLSTNAFGYDPALTSVLFEGPVPAGVAAAGGNQTFDTSHGVVISYLWAHDAAREAGGYTSPTWMGYTTRELVTATFAMDGYGTAPASVRVASGAAVMAPVDPTAPGKKFTGWFTSAALTTGVDFSDPVTADETLFAGWTSLAETGVVVTGWNVAPGVGALALGLLMVILARRRKITRGSL